VDDARRRGVTAVEWGDVPEVDPADADATRHEVATIGAEARAFRSEVAWRAGVYAHERSARRRAEVVDLAEELERYYPTPWHALAAVLIRERAR
jgi:hypothetical protein